jgi:hypothetical protein
VSVARRHDPSGSDEFSKRRRVEDGADRVKPRTVGRYVFWGVIGSGGCATVHLGRLLAQGGFSRTVAVKRLHSEYSADPDFVAMFLDEARLAARIRHPNVVQVLDVLWSHGPQGTRELFMIMDYVEGEALSRLVTHCAARSERPQVGVVLAIMCGVLRGLHAAHEARSESGDLLELVHRDVSPQNVVVGVDGVARLLDFGIAKAIGRIHTTRQGDFKGKAAYMAPEQILGTVSKLSDVYSASVVLWEALTAARLFKAENQTAILHNVVVQEVPRPSTIAPDISPAIEEIVMRGLARNASARFPSALAMAEAIESASALASHSEVGAWVRHVARAELALRAAQVADIERAEPAELLALTKDTAAQAAYETSQPVTRVDRAGPPSPLRRTRVRLALAIVLTLLATGVPVAVLFARRPSQEASTESVRDRAYGGAPEVMLEHSGDSDLADAFVRAEPTVEQTVSSSSAAHDRSLDPAPQRGRTTTPVGPRRTVGPVGSACTPPFLIDSAGRMHFKTECL